MQIKDLIAIMETENPAYDPFNTPEAEKAQQLFCERYITPEYKKGSGRGYAIDSDFGVALAAEREAAFVVGFRAAVALIHEAWTGGRA